MRHGGEGLQWARKGRQGVELVAILRRVVQMAKDWGVKTWIVKLDIRKAFDSVWQHSLSELVAARVGGISSPRFPSPPGGDHQPWEALLWLSLLQTRSLNVAVGDTLTPVPQSNGIRQGSPDSPDLFGAIIAKDLQAALQQAPPQPPDPQGGPPPPGSFLDDTYLWSQNRQHLQSLLGFLEGELARDRPAYPSGEDSSLVQPEHHRHIHHQRGNRALPTTRQHSCGTRYPPYLW